MRATILAAEAYIVWLVLTVWITKPLILKTIDKMGYYPFILVWNILGILMYSVFLAAAEKGLSR